MLMLMVPFIAIVVLMTATRGLDISEDVGVDAAQERWRSNGSPDHRITYRLNGIGPATVTFLDGVIADYEPGDPRLEDAPVYWVDSLLEAIDVVEDDLGGDVLAVEFDTDLGHPLSAAVDPERDREGDEWTIEVLEVELLVAP
ncbi:MAG: DUF6174 domain-containing protein [Acidimicrobiales bacterium]